MKLSSPPTRYAFTSVIAQAMKYGPTRVSRIAYELDMPVETCRYYLKRFHMQGFRFLPVVDYRALGLQPCALLIRFRKNFDALKRENFLRWLETVYAVYRASLGDSLEYYIETVPPLGSVNMLKKIIQMLVDAEILDNYSLSEVVDGYYKPEWINSYDFTKDGWGEKIEVDIPKIPLSHQRGVAAFDHTDLLLINELTRDPLVKMKKVSQKLGISPQLVSYHREKHVEGCRLVTGFIPARRTKHEDLQIQLIMRHKRAAEFPDEYEAFLHLSVMLDDYRLLRLHTPVNIVSQFKDVVFHVYPTEVKTFTTPVEYFVEKRWTGLETFANALEKMVRVF